MTVFNLFNCLSSAKAARGRGRPIGQAEEPEDCAMPYLQRRPLDHQVSLQRHSSPASGKLPLPIRRYLRMTGMDFFEVVFSTSTVYFPMTNRV